MVVDGGLIYLAMSSKDLERSVAFGFLEDLKSEFDQRYSEIVATAVAFEMNKTFAKVLTDKMDFFNQRAAEVGAGGVGAGEDKEVDGGGDKIKKVRGEIEEVKQVMTDNIERILDRGDKIELLVDKSQQLTEQVPKPFIPSLCQRLSSQFYHELRPATFCYLPSATCHLPASCPPYASAFARAS